MVWCWCSCISLRTVLYFVFNCALFERYFADLDNNFMLRDNWSNNRVCVIGYPRKFDVHKKYYVRGLIWSLNIKFLREPITHRAWDRRTLSFLLYNAKFWVKISKNGHHARIDIGRGETLSRHVIDFDQWEYAKMSRCAITVVDGLVMKSYNHQRAIISVNVLSWRRYVH